RSGDFLYTQEEYEVMRQDILFCKDVGCDGVVLGLLKSDGSIDVERTARLVEAAYPLEVTFHRAFDRCRDPFEALEQLIQIGCQRILTSGQKPTATEGIELIAQLVKAADERIVVMPGSGVRKENIKELRDRTGAIEFHTSLRSKQKSRMEFVHPAFVDSDDYMNSVIKADEISSLKNVLTIKSK
ncbi:MAG: copper homeostasis protein CutC, partial [Flavisolibacter sp.]|nr:copper homeostasis protein CutC [Flavisolibacter sp.]